jgi:hypothetical protein
MIGITVSTNYSDILPFILEENLKYFDKWIFITSNDDYATIDLLKDNPKIVILYWNFNNDGALFDKGGAIKLGQEYAYTNYPDDWYLIIDSDICLPNNFYITTSSLNTDCIYGITERLDFSKLSDFKNKTNYRIYNLGAGVGFFQLYKQHRTYNQSNSAGGCDNDFKALFKTVVAIPFVCYHLGAPGNWNGRTTGSDFIIDT